MNEQVLRTFHPNVRPYIREVMINGRIGIGAGNLRIADVQSGRPTIETSENGDRFKLSIPFAGQLIAWEIVFNSYRPTFPPDFNFHDESFLSDPEVDILEENVPSLAKWNAEDPKSLLHVISELLALYRKHQMGCLNYKQERVSKQTEYVTAEYEEGQHCLDEEKYILKRNKLTEDSNIRREYFKKETKLLRIDLKEEQQDLMIAKGSVDNESENVIEDPSSSYLLRNNQQELTINLKEEKCIKSGDEKEKLGIQRKTRSCVKKHKELLNATIDEWKQVENQKQRYQGRKRNEQTSTSDRQKLRKL